MTPRNEALAFRIWQYAEARGWDVTAGDIGEALGESYQRVGGVCRKRGWSHRLRVTRQEYHPMTGMRGVYDMALDHGNYYDALRLAGVPV